MIETKKNKYHFHQVLLTCCIMVLLGAYLVENLYLSVFDCTLNIYILTLIEL